MPDHGTFGGLRLIREIEPVALGCGRQARRWIALDDAASTAHVVYALPIHRSGFERRRFVQAADAASRARGAHILPIEAYALDQRRGGMIVTPFVGDMDGLLTLTALVAAKGGRLSPAETLRALIQMLEGLRSLHAAGQVDTALSAERMLVDPKGRLWIELPAFGWLMAKRPGERDELARADTLRVAQVARQCLGAASGAESPGLSGWLVAALSPLDGYPTPAAALAALKAMNPTLPPATLAKPGGEAAPSVGVVRGLMRRLIGLMTPR